MVAGCELMLEAGVDEVWTTHAVPTCLRTTDDLRLLRRRDYRSCDLSLYSTTPLGTCAVGADPRSSVVGDGGRYHGVEGLYVADASLLPGAPGVPIGHTVSALALSVADAVAADLGAAGS